MSATSQPLDDGFSLGEQFGFHLPNDPVQRDEPR